MPRAPAHRRAPPPPTPSGFPGRHPRRWCPTPLLGATAVVTAGVLAWGLRRSTTKRGLALALAAQGPMLAASLAPRSHWLGPNLTRLPGDDPAVALTFDDGPDPEVTPRVLDLLEAADLRASFFVIGRRAERHPRLVADIASRGHRIENHTHRHAPAFAFGGPRSMGEDIGRAQRLVTEITGRPPAYFRAPAGMRNPLLEPVLAGLGLHLASWTRRGFDTIDRSPQRILSRLTKGLRAGDILLLHDTVQRRRGNPPVLDVLPPLLDRIAAAGLGAGPLPEPEGGLDGGPQPPI
ncbi:MAG: polysaccharide deacetylase family protein [Acidobacteriota bacterium]